MKKILFAVIIITLAVGGYYYLKIDDAKTGESPENQKTVYSKNDVGLQFEYRTGPAGYVVEERMPVDLGTGLARVILLMRTEDSAKTPPMGGEGPPVIAISIFENTKKQFARTWADENAQYSNINLAQGDISEAVVGGANAIRYMADGLYASENIVVAHGDSVYVITGQFIDADSSLRRDFAPLVSSITFIKKPGQE